MSNPEPRFASSSAFVYGNDGLNPALRPTNGSLRAREQRRLRSREGDGQRHTQHEGHAGEGDDIYSSGSERDADEDLHPGSDFGSGSSPEPYMSDYDDENWGPLERGERMPRSREMRVRQGSEGYEVRPMGDWNIVDDHPMPRGDRPWEEEGRYNVYHPDVEWEEESDEGEMDVDLPEEHRQAISM